MIRRSATAHCRATIGNSARFRAPFNSVDRCNQTVEAQDAAKARISNQLPKCRSRVGETRGLDDDAPQRNRTSGQRPHRRTKIAAGRATETSVRQQQHVIRVDALGENCVVDADRAKLVHNDRYVVHVGLLKQRGNQCRLPAAEKTRHDREGNAVRNDKTSSASSVRRRKGAPG